MILRYVIMGGNFAANHYFTAKFQEMVQYDIVVNKQEILLHTLKMLRY